MDYASTRTQGCFAARALLGLVLLNPCIGLAESGQMAINVQAALIKNITHLIEWPILSSRSESSHFTVCVHGPVQLGSQFEEIFSRKTIKGKEARILPVSTIDLQECDVVYVAASPRKVLQAILDNASQFGVLTVSAHSGYGELGFHVNFYLQSEKLAFELNKLTLDEAGFQVSTQLYRYARIVK